MLKLWVKESVKQHLMIDHLSELEKQKKKGGGWFGKKSAQAELTKEEIEEVH